MNTAEERRPIRQEEDRISTLHVTLLLAGAVLFGAALVLAAWLALRTGEAALGRLAPPAPAAFGPPVIGGVTQTLINVDTTATSIRNQQEQRLESWGWVDQDRGIVRIPIERAMNAIIEARPTSAMIRPAAIAPPASVPPTAIATTAAAAPPTAAGPPLAVAAIQERTGGRLPSDLLFRDATSRTVRLGDAFYGTRPTLLILADYDCAMLCGLVLDGAARALRESGLVLGRDYQALAVGIDPRDSTEATLATRQRVLRVLGDPDVDHAWPFLTGDENAIRGLADSLGFRFKYDAASDQFSHPAALFVITPDGRIASYLYGIRFPVELLRSALDRARRFKIGASAEPFLLRCFRYMPALARHATLIRAVLWTGALLTLLLLGKALIRLWRADLRREAAP